MNVDNDKIRWDVLLNFRSEIKIRIQSELFLYKILETHLLFQSFDKEGPLETYNLNFDP